MIITLVLVSARSGCVFDLKGMNGIVCHGLLWLKILHTRIDLSAETSLNVNPVIASESSKVVAMAHNGFPETRQTIRSLFQLGSGGR